MPVFAFKGVRALVSHPKAVARRTGPVSWLRGLNDLGRGDPVLAQRIAVEGTARARLTGGRVHSLLPWMDPALKAPAGALIVSDTAPACGLRAQIKPAQHARLPSPVLSIRENLSLRSMQKRRRVDL